MQTSITDTSITLPSLDEIFRVLTFQAGFNTTVVILGVTFLGVAAGIIGAFSLLRKRALMGDALSHSTLPGLGAAFIISVSLGYVEKSLPILLLGATISGVLGVLSVQLLVHYTRLSEDTAIGAVLSVFFGVGIVLLSVIQSLGTGSESGLNHFIYGQTAAMRSSDAILTLALTGLSLFASLLLFKEFRIISFDEEFSKVQGWPVLFIDIVMMSLVVLVTVIGLQAVGMILIVALLIVPPAAARFWTERLRSMVFISALIGGASGYFGAAASSLLPRLPTGAVIVLAAGIIFFLSFFFAPSRGVFANALRVLKLRLKIAEEHLLRSLYEVLEVKKFQSKACNLSEVRIYRTWSHFFVWLLCLLSALKGYATFNVVGKGVTLTAKGFQHASRLVRNHRLWEEYILNFSHLSSSHVDYSADLAEHVLSKELITKLEAELTKKNLLPDTEQLKSPHPLSL